MEFELKLSTEDIKLLDEALVQLPYAKVFQLIDKLNQQIVEQEQRIEKGNNQMLLNKNTED